MSTVASASEGITFIRNPALRIVGTTDVRSIVWCAGSCSAKCRAIVDARAVSPNHGDVFEPLVRLRVLSAPLVNYGRTIGTSSQHVLCIEASNTVISRRKYRISHESDPPSRVSQAVTRERFPHPPSSVRRLLLELSTLRPAY